MSPLPPNAALEQAAVELLRQRLGYSTAECDRTFDGRPAGRGGKLFVGVWSPGDRQSLSRVALDERFTLNVTVTAMHSNVADDRLWQVRDRMEIEVNRVRALIHMDTWNHFLKRRANELAGLGDGDAKHVGFCEAMWLLGIDPWQEKAGEWFNAAQTAHKAIGVAQTVRFGGARLIQAAPTAR